MLYGHHVSLYERYNNSRKGMKQYGILTSGYHQLPVIFFAVGPW